MPAKFTKEQINNWRRDCQAWLDGFNAERGSDFTLLDFTSAQDAYLIMRRAGVQDEVYNLGGVDGHLQTVAEKIFPNAVFRDKKRY